MTELLTSLIAWTVANTIYAIPPQPPVLAYQSDTFFAEELCSPRAARSNVHCAFRAYYRDGTNTITLHENYVDAQDDPRARALLVHEIVHYLQDDSGNWGEKTCQSWIEREREALRLQHLYLVKQTGNYHLYLPSPSASQCPQNLSGKG